MRKRLVGAVLCVLAAGLALPAPATAVVAPVDLPAADPVVVATFDTGTNPFHPCFRRGYWEQGVTSPAALVPGYPADARALDLTFAETYPESLEASADALDAIEPAHLYYVPGTNLHFYGLGDAKSHFVDNYPHGAQASSQIACRDFGMADNAQLLVVNWYDDNVGARDIVAWVAEQPWIDVVHLNIQDYPLPVDQDVLWTPTHIDELVAAGKLVVIAGGNGVYGQGAAYPMEISSYNGPPGSLIAGANDNGGYTYYSNYNPHVVMDGMGTAAAHPTSFGETTFSGTSSASPRITGYAARLLGALRHELGHTGDGLLTIPAERTRPAQGPLSDGVLTAAELHEVIRRTANPNPHASAYDGNSDLTSPPQPVAAPAAVYAKMGYGEVSEHTLPAALDVAAGRAPMPARPAEDRFYEASETFRQTYWGP